MSPDDWQPEVYLVPWEKEGWCSFLYFVHEEKLLMIPLVGNSRDRIMTPTEWQHGKAPSVPQIRSGTAPGYRGVVRAQINWDTGEVTPCKPS